MAQLTKFYSDVILPDEAFIGFPLDAAKVLLGNYTFEQGANQKMTVQHDAVLVPFGVPQSWVDYQQSMGAKSPGYSWEGFIVTDEGRIHEEVENIKRLLNLGEIVTLIYLGKSTLVKVKSFTAFEETTCKAKYKIECVETKPQKIRMFNKKYYPELPSDYGLIPLPKPGIPDPNNPNNPGCPCEINIGCSGKNGYRSIPLSRIKDTSNPNPILTDDKMWSNHSGLLGKCFEKQGLDGLFTNIISHITKDLMLAIEKHPQQTCLISLINGATGKCPGLKEQIFGENVLSMLADCAVISYQVAGNSFTPVTKYIRLLRRSGNTYLCGTRTDPTHPYKPSGDISLQELVDILSGRNPSVSHLTLLLPEIVINPVSKACIDFCKMNGWD